MKVEGTKVVSRGAIAVGQGGCAYVYVLDPERRAEILRQISELFQGEEGIESIIAEKDFAKHGLSTPDQDPRMADLVLTANEGKETSSSRCRRT